MKLEDRVNAIARCSLLDKLDEHMTEQLAALASCHTYEAGQLIFQQGQAGDYLFLITWGVVRRTITTTSGREFMLDIVGQGDLLGLLSFFDGGERETACIALHRTQVLRINYAAMSPPLKISIAPHFNSPLYVQLRTTIKLLGEMTMFPLETRLARLLLRLDRRNQVRPVLSSDRLHQGLLALMVNASRSKVNEQLQRFNTLGAIRLEAGAVFVSQSEILEKIAAE